MRASINFRRKKLNSIEQKNQKQQFETLPTNLRIAFQYAYGPAGIEVTTQPRREAESEEYGACRFAFSGKSIVFRVAKTTPTKIGQFVTTWKRPSQNAEIVPFDANDQVDFIVISVFDEKHQGQFVFNREVLMSKGIMSKSGKGGKLSFRVYPPWTKPIVPAAIKTQKWQMNYFFSITKANFNPAQVLKLFGI